MSAGGLGEGVRRATRELTARMVDDARGRRVRLYDLNAWPWDHLRGDDSISKSTYDAIIALLHPPVRQGKKIAIALGLVAGMIVCSYCFTVALRARPVPYAGMGSLFAIAIAVQFIAAYRLLSQLDYGLRIQDIPEDTIAEAIREHGHCASCGQSLRELPTAADGCTVCPECGSAWRID